MKSPLPKIAYERNAEIYRLMANPIRLEILNSLKVHDMSVEELTDQLDLRKANVSQHLSVLRQAGLVYARRDGHSVYYAISDPRIVEPCTILYQMWSQQTKAPVPRRAVRARSF